jgi:hypothetical protein
MAGSRKSKEIEAQSRKPLPQGYVPGAGEGEHLVHFRNAGNIFINADAAKGANNFARARSHPSAQAFLLTVRRIPAALDFAVSRATCNTVRHAGVGFPDAHDERNAARDDCTNQHRPAEL